MSRNSDALRVVWLFGRRYWWHKPPGQPLELLPFVPLPIVPERTPEEMFELVARLLDGPLPWPEKE